MQANRTDYPDPRATASTPWTSSSTPLLRIPDRPVALPRLHPYDPEGIHTSPRRPGQHLPPRPARPAPPPRRPRPPRAQPPGDAQRLPRRRQRCATSGGTTRTAWREMMAAASAGAKAAHVTREPRGWRVRATNETRIFTCRFSHTHTPIHAHRPSPRACAWRATPPRATRPPTAGARPRARRRARYAPPRLEVALARRRHGAAASSGRT